MRERGMSYNDIASALGLSVTGVRGRVSRYRAKQRVLNADAQASQVAVILPPSVNVPPPPARKPRAPSADDVDYTPPVDDSAAFDALVRLWRRTRGYIRMMQVADLHCDDHSVQAVLMHAEIARRYKPDLILYTGDTHDFSEISKFPQSWRSSARRDLFKRYSDPWLWVVDVLHNAAPEAVQLAFNGNHNERLDTVLNEYWMFAETIIDQYAAMMRANGRVLWIDRLQELDIGPYYVQHGTRVGENAAKNALKDLGWSQSGAQGHTHQFSQYTHAVKVPGSTRRRIVQYTVAPCSCNIPPAYQHTSKQSKWTNGVLLTTVNLRGDDIHEYPIIYHQDTRARMIAAYAGEVLTVAPPSRYARERTKTRVS
jgi:hypothetical protein